MNGPHELTFFTDRDLGHRFAQSAPFIAKVRRDGVKVWVRFTK